MPASDIYDVKSGLLSVSVGTQTPVLELRSNGTTAKRAFITGCRIRVGSTSAGSGNYVSFTLARVSNTPTGGTAVTPSPQDTASGAALSGAYIGSWTTAPTAGAVLAEWTVPQTPGMWVEFPPLGYEWVLPVATASIAGFVTLSDAVATSVAFEWVVSE